MGLSFAEAKYIHSLVQPEEPETRIAAANVILQMIGPELEANGQEPVCRNVPQAHDILRAALKIELETDKYLIAATLCWGTTLFDARPQSVRLIWDGLQKHPELLVYGSGSMGKSYTAIVFGLLDYERDPEFTTTKLVSTTEGHAKAQTFSNLVRLHRFSAVPLSGYIKEGFIGLDKNDERSSISEVAIPQGEDGKARLQGFHPLPRPYPHPKFGNLTRVRGIFDEAEDIPPGLWKGVSNMMLNMDDQMHVSIVAMWNPKKRDSMAAQKAEPVGGWVRLDERLDEYKSKLGYHCIRLDARKCENVIQKKEVFIGLQTFEGYRKLEQEGGPDYDTFGKGVYPSETAAFNIISPISLDNSRGTLIWGKIPTPLGALDMAEEGEDKAEFTSAKYGMAIGFEPEGSKRKMFNVPRWAVQFEQQFPLEKQNTILMGKEAIQMCRMLHIRPEWFALDCTNSVTLRDWIRLKWGQIVGVKWGEGATDLPILEEESEKASDLYANIKTEMWFAMAAWAEFGYVAFSPHMDTSRIFAQLAGMRYRRIGKIMKRCEETKEFKKRYGGQSPDEAASAVMIIHLVRLMATYDQTAAMEPQKREPTDYLPEPVGTVSERGEPLDSITFI